MLKSYLYDSSIQTDVISGYLENYQVVGGSKQATTLLKPVYNTNVRKGFNILTAFDKNHV